jgi:hypothetical protein
MTFVLFFEILWNAQKNTESKYSIFKHKIQGSSHLYILPFMIFYKIMCSFLLLHFQGLKGVVVESPRSVK